MAEQTIEVHRVKVVFNCDVPGCNGRLVATGYALESYPPQNLHECSECKVQVYITGKTYPHYKEIELSI